MSADPASLSTPFSDPGRAKRAAKRLLSEYEKAGTKAARQRIAKATKRAALKAARKGNRKAARTYKLSIQHMHQIPALNQDDRAPEEGQKEGRELNYRSNWNKFVSEQMDNYSPQEISSGKAMKAIAKKWRKQKGKAEEKEQKSGKSNVQYTLEQNDGGGENNSNFSDEDLTDLGAPIGWIGGKSTVADKIVDKIPSHTTYVEPFFGAGHIFFTKAPSEKEVINDKDPRVADFFKNLPEVDPSRCDRSPDKDRFETLKDKDRFQGEKGKVCDLLFLNKWSYNNDMQNYVTEKKPKYSKIRNNWEKYRARLNGVKVLNQDFATVMEKYDGPDTFFYLDPPYYLPDQDHYKLHDLDPTTVKDAVEDLDGKFLLSYNNHEKVREVFSEYNQSRMKITYTVSTRQTGSQDTYELLISNYTWN